MTVVGCRGSVAVGWTGSAVVAGSLEDQGKVLKIFLIGDRCWVTRGGLVMNGSSNSIAVKCFGDAKLSNRVLIEDRDLTGEMD